MTHPDGKTGSSSGQVESSRPRVVIVGGGFGGLFAAKFLRRADVDVTLIERNNHHLFQPLLYQVATGVLSPGEVAPPLREVLKRHSNVTVEMGEVTGFDLEQRVVRVSYPESRGEVSYDYLIVGTGVGGSYFGHDEYATHAPGMKTLQDALDLRTKIFGAFERAETTQDVDERAAWLTFSVVGGGPTGVEVAGQICELAQRSLQRNFRRLDPRSTRVILFEGSEEILSSFGDNLSAKATRELEKLGVEVRANTRVVGMTASTITVSGPDGEQTLPSRTKIWAAGVAAGPLAGNLAEAAGAETDRSGRVVVLPDCTLPGHREIFVVGDAMAMEGLPGVAEVAMQSGIHAAVSIKRATNGHEDPRPFKYRDLGSMATVARFNSVVEFKGVKVAGIVGWLMWAMVHLTFLTGFKNRFFTSFHWVVSLVGRARDERPLSWGVGAAALDDAEETVDDADARGLRR